MRGKQEVIRRGNLPRLAAGLAWLVLVAVVTATALPVAVGATGSPDTTGSPGANGAASISGHCAGGQPQLDPQTQERLAGQGAQVRCSPGGALVITYPAAPVQPAPGRQIEPPQSRYRLLPEDSDGVVFIWINGVPLRTPPARDGGFEPDAFVVRSSGRTVMPIRFITEAIGGEVKWDPASQGVTLRWGDREVRLTIGSTAATVNGRPITIDQPPFLWQDRTFVPTRFLMEAFGAQVQWDPANSSVLVNLPGARCLSQALCGQPRGVKPDA